MKNKLCLSLLSGALFIGLGAVMVSFQEAKDLNVFTMQTGSPVIPAYLADATIIYDRMTDLFPAKHS
jgi:hypothetical protein